MKASEKFFVLENAPKREYTIGNHKWDKCLDDYYNYVKEYKMHYKKSKEGNEMSLSLYPYMKEKWQSLKKRIHRAYQNKRLNEKQIERVVNMKIVKACSK
ncbi:hypothetical protein H4V97_001627 [Flavobacterium sp. CG_23.5]|uniref:hypothetical protein n=1 Tax=unclassified Flavobacterium TaxID=196869 RepID=UPI0018CB04B3|nr:MULTISPECIES: hypothetical protein [unclassified Flavobacterium]MBG6109447.1 hypothetical protein [Flavobacterium sp. CG_9.10]MBP2283309.1 hypothetical protein [Flavobacterium sp. CG_23.5]